MLLGLVMRRCKNSRWKNETRPRQFPKAFDGLYFDLRRCRGCHPVARVCFIQSNLRIFRYKPTCGSSMEVSLGLVPLKPGWPCLDTNSTAMIMSLPSEPINLGHTILIFLAFSPRVSFLIFDLSLGSSHNQRNKESLLIHMVEDLEAYTNTWANKFVNANLLSQP